MRFMVSDTSGRKSVYLIDGDDAVDLAGSDPDFLGDMSCLFDRLSEVETIAASAPRLPTSSLQPALPIEKPGKVICLGLNYVDHIKEGGYEVPSYPALFMRATTSLMAAGEPMVQPSCSEQLDYEAEMMVIIGKGGRHISETNALDHVFGYTIFNDGSVREYQRKTHQWTPGKNFDSTGPIGPTVVTPDELPEGGAGLKIESRVGDEILQSATTSDMLWTTARTISTISEYSTLEPGDLIALGTPPGVGHAKKPNPRWLRPGEVIEIEIERIGILASPVVAEEDLTTASA